MLYPEPNDDNPLWLTNSSVVRRSDEPFPFSPWDWQRKHSRWLFVSFPQDPERLKSHRIPREHSSQLCKHSVLMCFFFFDDGVCFCDQGQFGRGQQRWADKQTHTHTRSLWVVCQNTCASEKESNTKHLSFFILQPWGDTSLFPPHISPLWILIPARERMGPLKYDTREAIKHRAGHHSSVKGILLMCYPSNKSTFAKYIHIVVSVECM